MTNAEILSLIWSRCIPYGECLLWDGSTDSDGRAQVRIRGKKGARSVRRELLTAMGVSCDGRVATSTCSNSLCMAPEHVVSWTRKKLQKRTMGRLTGDVRLGASVAVARRRQYAKLTDSQVREIRESEATARELGTRFGVAACTVSRVRRGEIWKVYGGLFTGLIAANDAKRRSA